MSGAGKKMKIIKGDRVVVLSGKDKGVEGVVERAIPETGKVIVEGVNVAKKHQKGNPQTGQEGGIVNVEQPIHRSNVRVWNPIAKKGDRIGFKILEDGKKVRIYKSTNEVVDV